MIINGNSLVDPSVVYQPPIKDMVLRKVKEHGVTYGLGEAGYDLRIAQEIRFTKCNTPNPENSIVRAGEVFPD